MKSKKLYHSKNRWILPRVCDKKVLDLGCVRHNLEETKKEGWLHGEIVKRASEVLGVDYLENEITELKNKGFNVTWANVENMDFNETFEVIVGGDIIEHLTNFEGFLTSVRKHMAPGSVFLISTPNPVTPLRLLRLFLSGKVSANKEHTCWFTEKVLRQLLKRFGFQIKSCAYVDDVYQYYRKPKHVLLWPFMAIFFLLCFIRPQTAETLCFEIMLDGE